MPNSAKLRACFVVLSVANFSTAVFKQTISGFIGLEHLAKVLWHLKHCLKQMFSGLP